APPISGGSSLRIAFIVSMEDPPWNARFSENISYKIAPKLKMSLRESVVFPRTCSGDMYPTVPKRGQCLIINGFVDCRLFGETKIEDFHSAIGCHEQIFRLEVAMDNSFIVCSRESCGNLNRELNCFALGNSTSLNVFAERLTFQQFGDNEMYAVLGSNIV